MQKSKAVSAVRYSFKPAATGALCALSFTFGCSAYADYVEQGRLGDAASWRSAEFQSDWGLGRIQAEHAYAAGITGAGVKIGALDSGYDPSHPEASPSRFHAVTASGTYVDGSPFSVTGAINPNNDTHGTHVTGTMGAARDGAGVHGVAYNAQIYVGNTNKNDSFLFGPSPDPRYFKAVYGALADAGVRAINNSWGSQPSDVTYATDDGMRAAYAQHYNRGTWLDEAANVSRKGVINVFSAGNSGYANASVRASLPYFQPDLEGHWLAVSGLDSTNGQRYNQCGVAKYWCITTPGRLINGTVPGGGYGIKSGTSMSAPHATGALALVMERFPYMNNEQALQVLLTTATQLDGSVTQAPNTNVGWGVANLERAMRGPGQLLGTFDATLGAGQTDTWSNDISDQALIQRQAEDRTEQAAWQQTLISRGWQNGVASAASQQDQTDYAVGIARAAAAAQRQYQGSLIKSGTGRLILEGDNTYRGDTLVNAGLLSVNGSLVSAVQVNTGGTLGGTGQIGGLTARSGGSVAPGNSIGTLQVNGDVVFEPGSTYAVELSPTASDRLVATGSATVSGANMTLALDETPVALNASSVQTLEGRQYTVLQAANGVNGQFGSVSSSYAFLGGRLDYAATGIALNIDRTAAFDSVAQTPNQAAVATAAEQLGAGNAVYENLLLSPSAASARNSFQQLSGEVYPAIGTVLINDSRQVRDAVGERLNASAFGTEGDTPAQDNVWLKALGAWGKTDSRDDTAGYTTSIGGLLAGVDGKVADDTRLGLVAGYSDSSLAMGSNTHSRASVDSYHLGAYVGHEMGALRLTLGSAYSWHRIDAKRDVQVGGARGRETTKHDAQTAQVFTEAAYRIRLQPATIEPFANLAYVHLATDGFTEKGDAAALSAGRDKRDAVLSTLGARALKTISLNDQQKLELSGSLGWQHNLSDTDSQKHLAFASSGASFGIESSPLVRDAALVGAHASLAVSKDARVSLDYNGQLASREKIHGIGLSLNWQF
ncbi:autotransporter domain-containing protein [Pseudomonas alliivorans]|uniref:autotransporter serine peptidase EprS n=1 Tax=Pseudomonas alliivorans TaxID=2810613 RepID=UPI001AE885A3|nr:autotransporter serine protease [Pseudomonas alliivorans]MBP0938483.1 autotransporter domain-containing protein [Pseudomonas alliivorans]MEE4881495.1 autotransporter domain-containing protein [Pseudomonas alliivorans]MEE4930159.1 autotransporter domain-containing protein [Pseudomonas alliivorans]MEE4933330.1 autotransporter domain-containing protein [Pseudomonas alliivorans]MEE4942321.1 autotransporter domain-containing protein [Pseudomonas alliivorans]